tara:strand:+ start:536 stop:910 length:375 start_codon:yes stop_codon:yes gene_type:complete
MSYALINRSNNSCCTFVPTEDDCFECHEDFRWVDIPDDWVQEEGTNPPDFMWNPDLQEVQRVTYEPGDWDVKRLEAYDDLGASGELALLWDDIDAGVFGEKIKSKSKFYLAIKQIKDANPKPTV